MPASENTQGPSPKLSAMLGGVLLTILILLFSIMKLDVIVLPIFGRSHPAILYFAGRSFYFLIVFVIWCYAFLVEKQPLLIWKEQHYSLATGLSHLFTLFVVVLMSLVIVGMILHLIIPKKTDSEALRRTVNFLRANQFLLIYTALTAGITEELIFRGYLLPRLELLTRSPYAAIFISSLLFGLGHFGFGTIQNIVGPFVIGLIQAVYYWRYRNIHIVILFHFLWDLVGLYFLASHNGYNF